MEVPRSHKPLAAQPSVLEARHFAAAYALYRVCNMRNLHMMMPPTYKDLWKDDFTELKNADVKAGRGWMYEADPFLAKQERDSAAVDIEKKQKDQKNSQNTGKENTVQLGLSSGGQGQGQGKRIWSQAPKVDLGNKVRREIESLLRQYATWNPYKVRIPDQEQKAIVDEFSNLGFRRSHVEEGAAACKDREEVLEWLLVYVPEDDLPQWSLPEGYSAGVSLASDDLAREAKIKRLASAGYPTDLCSSALDGKGGDELAAAEFLQNTLVHGTGPSPEAGSPEGEESWAEEQETLEAIFGERYVRSSPHVCEIKGEEAHSVSFRFQKPSGNYPMVPPVISVQAKIPSYIRLSAIRQAVKYAEEMFSGEPMVFNIIDWLETHLPEIKENPGKLWDISAVTASSSVAETESQIPIRQSRKKRKGVDWNPNSPQSISVKEAWEAKKTTKAQQEMLQKREALPA